MANSTALLRINHLLFIRFSGCLARDRHRMSAMTDTSVPQATFLNFLSGLGAQGLIQVGAMPNPLTGARAAHPAFARYTLELLQVLREKTAGNRTPEEDQYLTTMITDLGEHLARIAGPKSLG